jgi:hypothetical protein
MDVKEIIEMGGLVELAGPLLIFLRAGDVEPAYMGEDAFVIAAVRADAVLRVETLEGNKVTGILECPGRVVVCNDGAQELEEAHGLEFIASAMDLEKALWSVYKEEA